ncbi:MAG: hypothetical protein K0U41_09360 [Gammaproteobacteria bacterium]|nr:hypothetical protein [Gammaproteobacteria bacterium]
MTMDKMDLERGTDFVKAYAVALKEAKKMEDELNKQGRNIRGGIMWEGMQDDMDSPIRIHALRTEVARMILAIDDTKQTGLDECIRSFELFERSMVFIKYGMDTSDRVLVHQINTSQTFVEDLYAVHKSLIESGNPDALTGSLNTVNRVWN